MIDVTKLTKSGTGCYGIETDDDDINVAWWFPEDQEFRVWASRLKYKPEQVRCVYEMPEFESLPIVTQARNADPCET